MISTAQEYEAAKTELSHLEAWLSRLDSEHPSPGHGLSKVGIRKTIARLHEESALMKGVRRFIPRSDGYRFRGVQELAWQLLYQPTECELHARVTFILSQPLLILRDSHEDQVIL